MSLITCCPACGTMFRVVPDQLKISEGWVRCGHCSEVFDATAHMTPDVAAQQAEADTQPAPPSLQADTRPTPIRPSQPEPEPEPDPRDSALSESPLDQPFVFRRSDLVVPESESPPLSVPAPPLSRPARLQEDEPGDEPELHHVSFVRQARRAAFWRRRGVRLWLVFFMLLLSALLAFQVAVQDRDRLAVTHPQLRPALETLCDALLCKIQPPRQIERLAIETSAFNKLRSDAYRLSFTLKNNAQVQVAMPSMELTLTDGQDQPVLRRVLAPSELGGPATLAAGAEWSTSLGIAVNANGQTARIAGYRLLAFYP